MPDPNQPENQPPMLPLRMIGFIGAYGLHFLGKLGGILYLLIETIFWINRAFTTNRVRIGRAAIVSQVVRLGVRAIGIMTLLAICIGSILALQMEPPLRDFNQQDKIANIIGVAVLRELGPLISAIVMTGFAGAAIAAEIGTMVVGEEIEALEAHALNPIRFLVVPRVIATTFSLILLSVWSDITAIIAGMGVSVYVHEVPWRIYWENTLGQCTVSDFVTGLVKAAVFGTLIGLISCYNGLRVSGGAAGVGHATTDTVVSCIISIIFADLIFTSVFFILGWA